ncbi:MAG: methyltransferase domain-containing protein [Anaerolineae bacterium]|nr:methyltransferase domain-containing protein [Anaerolineae bacterium]NIN98533.1 methyltransferase domain-containing protein [Anaerolineae bacterium]NIQ81426.1 methyltransferase domain-containing protein [Anaerolineae bacterium]
MSYRHVDYDQIAPTYDQRYGALEYEGIASTLSALARAGSVDRILEVGCGTGRWLAELQTIAPQVYGLDVSLGMLKEADRELTGRLVCGQASDLPFSEALFDLILCVNALHHFDQKQGFILEARQALLPGGTLAIIGMDPHTRADHWYLYRYFEGTREKDLARYPSADSIREWMTDAGFLQVRSGVAEHIQESLTGREVLQSPFLQKHGTSQLAILTDEAYEAGLNRIKADLEEAETAGRPLRFEVDISLALVTGRAPEGVDRNEDYSCLRN